MDPDSIALRVVAFLAFVGLVAGATALAYDAIDARAFPVQAEPVVAERTTAPGFNVSFPVALHNLEGGQHTLQVAAIAPPGLEASAPSSVDVSGEGSGFWVEVAATPEAEPGSHRVDVTLTRGGKTQTTPVAVRVEHPDEVVEAGDTVRVNYVGRFPNGTVFGTNVEAVDDSPIPKAPRYRPPKTFDPLSIDTGPQGSFIEGFKNGVVGVGVGHDVTIHIPPSQGYGEDPARETQPREQTIDRTIEQRRLFNLSRQSLSRSGYVDENTQEGDEIRVGQPPRVRVFNVTWINETRVELLQEVEVGDRTTHHTPWPNSSVAVAVNATHATYRVDPPEDGGPYTWRDHWPNATTIVEVGEENITLRHSPEVGTTWTQPVQRRGQPVRHEVVEVRDDAIVVEHPNPAPLAGENLVFDVSVLEIR